MLNNLFSKTVLFMR